MAVAYICYASSAKSALNRQVINAPVVISNTSITSTGTSAVVTLLTDGGYINVGATATTSDRYLPAGVPCAVNVTQGEVLSFIGIS